jgi:hypothetical protein
MRMRAGGGVGVGVGDSAERKGEATIKKRKAKQTRFFMRKCELVGQ